MTNHNLLNLYKSKIKELTLDINLYNEKLIQRKGNPNDRATNPLMLKVDENWEKSKLRVMIFGQENNVWAGECGNEGVYSGKIEEVIKIYDQFYLKDTMYACPFWNEFRRIKESLPDESSVAWNNIVKIGRIGVGCIPEIHSLTMKSFNVIRDEIKILKPNILIFLTGPKYDQRIKDALGAYTINPMLGFSSRQMGIIQFEENYNLKKCIRTYHPGYLYRDKNRRKLFMENLINEISQSTSR